MQARLKVAQLLILSVLILTLFQDWGGFGRAFLPRRIGEILSGYEFESLSELILFLLFFLFSTIRILKGQTSDIYGKRLTVFCFISAAYPLFLSFLFASMSCFGEYNCNLVDWSAWPQLLAILSIVLLLISFLLEKPKPSKKRA